MDIVKLREMLEGELSSDELSPLDEGFYRDYDSLMKALKLGAESSRERGEEIEERLYLEQLKIAEGLMREILRVRLHKLVDMAFSGTPPELVDEEKRMFLVLKAFVERGELPGIEVVSPESIPSESETANEEPSVSLTSKAPTEAYIVTEDVPRILDENLNEYGPIKAGDLAVLPRSIADVLLKRGVAQKIRLSF
ncbi:hypothetical protein A3L09_04730 [Thermococcus profundus]|uniref:Gins51 C-terminal domain-containing protein n=1 Tax=Thermococcus profundus TaxID=49899 RepID=A0A2Z2MD28_THEPR|nr:hypothetical protein [Thermococcus profundus]ASJ02612.1 hypothetical protein A3L09_04730 [Thermococcus profundus]